MSPLLRSLPWPPLKEPCTCSPLYLTLPAPTTNWYFPCLSVNVSPHAKIWAPQEAGAVSCSPPHFQRLWVEFIQDLDWMHEFSRRATRSVLILRWSKKSELVAQRWKSLAGSGNREQEPRIRWLSSLEVWEARESAVVIVEVHAIVCFLPAALSSLRVEAE